MTTTSGTGDQRWSHSAAFVDYDRDGWLDLYVANYLDYRIASHRQCQDAAGRLEYCAPGVYPPAADSLYRNLGNCTFEDVTAPAGLLSRPANGLGVVTADFDGNGWQDIYVANDAMANTLWLNQGDGSFADDALMRGVAVNNQGHEEASMGVNAADVDGDGDLDLFMTHIRDETNTLFLNDGEGSFSERTARAGLAGSSLGLTGFGTAFLDFDNDGWLDLMVVNGAVKAVRGLLQAGHPFPYGQRDVLYRNTDGVFKEMPDALPGHVDTGRGLAVGDVDNDGDSDALVINNNGPARLLENTVGQPVDEEARWVGLRVLDQHGRDAIGAVVQVDSGQATHRRRIHTDASYLSASDPRVLVGLGDHPGPVNVTVFWLDGSNERWMQLPAGGYHRLTRGEGEP